MTRPISMAVVLEGGLVQALLVEDWPTHIPLPRIAVMDYDTEGADDDEITHFLIGDKPEEAICHSAEPEVYESLTDALSPRAVLAALDDLPKGDDSDSPLSVARSVRQSILDLDARLNHLEQAPTGDDYNELYVLANCGLIDVLEALGDPADFGE
ncbi:hypothetical protein [Stenotrophomonas sp. NLF4-10]|uniref:hypothetical protein n=1 Tax=Stenotrophomonas sp. NLF4-10 TaxID=2918754 RepID=UPI001EFA979A|nr:hypothetical protein [Stenotrophomonas sp. NLF4-10]MCG8277421.1 hypothetical protein [Stenotrophomonas sp. NLF4-10]